MYVDGHWSRGILGVPNERKQVARSFMTPPPRYSERLFRPPDDVGGRAVADGGPNPDHRQASGFKRAREPVTRVGAETSRYGI